MNDDLVSICVISYNSMNTIVETLESIKNQTYQRIELIISDDCSQDKTVCVVNDWIKENKSRFVNTEFLTSEINCGVTKNCNKALRRASGFLLKDIAADDVLDKNYIESCVEFFSENKDAKVLMTDVWFENLNHEKINKKYDVLDYSFFEKNNQEQSDYVLKGKLPTIPTPSMIVRRDLFEYLGFYDERIPMWEDGPFFFRLAENKVKIYFLNKELVKIYVRDNSLSNGFNKRFVISAGLFYKYYQFKYDVRRNFIFAMIRYVFNFIKINIENKLCLFIFNRIKFTKENNSI